ncbi:hypothetical protein P8452_37978 [Trifolium repens]|nr:hypothetical protein P8452_37978 [Trifolium repens]
MPTALREKPSAATPITPPHQTSTHRTTSEQPPTSSPCHLLLAKTASGVRTQTPLRPTTQTPQHRIKNSRSNSDDPPPAAPPPTLRNTAQLRNKAHCRKPNPPANTLQTPAKHQQTPKTHQIEPVTV